jgi:nucleotide-binding universal stress UspA family protein
VEAQRPAVLCYDGSDPARRALEHAGAVLDGGPAVVLTVWESVASGVLRHGLPLPGEMGRETSTIAKDVVEQLDSGAAERARAVAAEGAELADAAGFAARPEARRALARAAERDTATVWHAILDFADEVDAGVIAIGRRGRSGVSAALLGSVSYGVVHHSRRPLLVVPPGD